MAKKIFIIGPVRDIGTEAHQRIKEYVESLENMGLKVHWPPRDTDQNDPVGLNICLTNGTKIFEAEEVHIWFDPASKGSIFDRGMLCSFLVQGLEKQTIIINRSGFSQSDLPDLKSDIERARGILENKNPHGVYPAPNLFQCEAQNLVSGKEKIDSENKEICLEFDSENPDSLFALGVFFGWTKILGLNKKLIISNLESLQPTSNKSFVKVIHALLNGL